MKILVTGSNSYIGNSFIKWVNKWPNKYQIESISVRGDEWKQKDFSCYDSILHVAGIAHVNAKPEMEPLYYKVNRDLTIEVAQKAKKEGVKQFIFMSSVIVFGESCVEKQNVVVTKNTKPTPNGFYGNSKLEAELGILPLQSDNFNVVIIRPPMIYGKCSKGNFPKLAKLAKKIPIFPSIDNERSMLYIDNLCEFIRLMIDNREKGIFHPQNQDYVKTTEMVKLIAEVHGKKILVTNIFNPFVNLIGKKVDVVNKVFGTFIYEKEMSVYKEKYCIADLKESIELTEGVKQS